MTLSSGVIHCIETHSRRHPLYIKVFNTYQVVWEMATQCHFPELHGLEDGTVPATFQIIYLVESLCHSTLCLPFNAARNFQIGWKPAPTQPKPLERGTAETNLKEVL